MDWKLAFWEIGLISNQVPFAFRLHLPVRSGGNLKERNQWLENLPEYKAPGRVWEFHRSRGINLKKFRIIIFLNRLVKRWKKNIILPLAN